MSGAIWPLCLYVTYLRACGLAGVARLGAKVLLEHKTSVVVVIGPWPKHHRQEPTNFAHEHGGHGITMTTMLKVHVPLTAYPRPKAKGPWVGDKLAQNEINVAQFNTA